VNGGLAGASVGGETSVSASCERMDRESDQKFFAGESAWFDARPRVVREHHPAVDASPKAARQSRDRGYEARATAIALVVVDHRILRRVLTDGRHPGSKEASPFTRGRGERSWRLLHPRDPHTHPKRSWADFSKEDARAKARETKGKRERRQGCQRLGRNGHRRKKTPTLVIEVGDDFDAGRSTRVEIVFALRSAEAVWTS